MSKQIKRVSLIIILIMAVISCFRGTYASVLDDIASISVQGVAGLLTIVLQQAAVLFFAALHALTGAITGIGSGSSSGRSCKHR